MPTPAFGSQPTPPEPKDRGDWGGYGRGGAPDLRTQQAGGSGGFNPFLYSMFLGGGQIPFQGAGYTGPFHNMNQQMPFRYFMPPRIGWNGMQGIRPGGQQPMPSQPQQPPQAQPPAMQNQGLFGAMNPFMGGR